MKIGGATAAITPRTPLPPVFAGRTFRPATTPATIVPSQPEAMSRRTGSPIPRNSAGT